MSKHTPGPWDTGVGDMTVRVNRLSDEIAKRFGDDSDRQVEGNAALLLAAPELLAAARLANQELIDLGVGSSGSPALVALWSAIAKAEGRDA